MTSAEHLREDKILVEIIDESLDALGAKIPEHAAVIITRTLASVFCRNFTAQDRMEYERELNKLVRARLDHFYSSKGAVRRVLPN